ncbi:FAD-binding oxidoreductase [Flavobacterium sp. D11R37]|uniref:NAD(P)/FAD-dependent oxidoreductase n=1 Tax=Flavobacterium coralii TaxID=2838017 RepID=UPI001CA6C8F5|nr:FAD-binding oxidoreductase [Flavobacterium coralii]MBY8962281.1 FAD-binding oxidoreductase [Flavobacterium coralii]
MKDFIIVGGGIAGISFAETCLLNQKEFVLITETSGSATTVAGGVYNPVILKRLNLPLDAAAHMQFIMPFYRHIEQRLGVSFMHDIPVYRKFASVEEQNNWFQAADKPALEPFLDTDVKHTNYIGLPATYGFGRVIGTGYMDTALFLKEYYNFLTEQSRFLIEAFEYSELQVNTDSVSYKGIEAKHIVFAEGFGLKNNPYFNYLPLNGTKGELLLIKAPGLNLNVIAKGNVFIIPLGNDIYKVGATYEWEDKTTLPTEKARAELVEKLDELINCPYEIIGQTAGIRPTVTDRKPLVGTHHMYSNLHLLNGLGTRGVMLGPPMARHLFDSIENNIPVPKEVNLNRFKV